MKTEKNILVAFLLNFLFSIIEFIGGLITRSVAIMSDSIHDIGDSISIGFSYFLEKKSKKKPDDKFTYGYIRYSVLGSFVTTSILFVGSCLVIYNAILRIINPVEIHYNRMILFAVFGVVVNFLAAYFTKDGHSLNQKAVNLHMLEDVLGWVVVLIGAIVMRFTNWYLLDPILSILVALFIIYHTFGNFKEILDLFLEKTPKNININEIKEHLTSIEGVIDVHHIHIWSMDGNQIFATMHVVTNDKFCSVKHKVKEELEKHGINHSTIEFESTDEKCHDCECKCYEEIACGGCHHHHHHH